MSAVKLTLSEIMDANTIPEPMSGCWLWIGATAGKYGRVQHNGKKAPAHRVAYILAKGPIDKSLVVDHKCRLRFCVNPDHLEAVSNKENVMRGIGPSAVNRTKTHCIRGHAFDAANTRRNPKTGFRQCRICDRAYSKFKAAQKKLAQGQDNG